MTANAIADLPFLLVKDNADETVYDDSAAWMNNLGGLPSPKRIIRLLAASLCGGQAYVIPTLTNQGIIDLHYCNPATVSPQITMQGLQYFIRSSDVGVGNYAPAPMSEEQSGFSGEMLYFWLPDHDIEIGPAKCHPLGTALLSTELLANMDGTLKSYSERGFIPPTILAAKGMPAAGEREKTESWWNRFLRGWSKNAAKIINAETMEIHQVGAGFGDLRTVYHDLTRQQIENIGASHGIPGALFMSDMAFASEFNAMTRFWYSTSEFISIYQCIAETLNAQLFDRFGLKMVFHPETIDAFQEDEKQRSQAYSMYVSADMRPSIAAEMLGLELPGDVDYKDLDKKYDKPDPVMPPGMFGAFPAKPKPTAPGEEREEEEEEEEEEKAVRLDAQQIKDLDLWRQVAVRNHRKGKGSAADFRADSIPGCLSDPIRQRLMSAQNELDVLKAFDLTYLVPETKDDTDGLRLLLETAIKSQTTQPINVTVNMPAETKTIQVSPTPIENNVKVEAAQINVPEALAPQVVVNVDPTPVTITNEINVPENVPDVIVDKVKKAKVLRGKDGKITGIEAENG
jgi:hypothetical protein